MIFKFLRKFVVIFITLKNIKYMKIVYSMSFYKRLKHLEILEDCEK